MARRTGPGVAAAPASEASGPHVDDRDPLLMTAAVPIEQVVVVAIGIVIDDLPPAGLGLGREPGLEAFLAADPGLTRRDALQKRLLENAAFMLKPGGVLIYCTCSLQKLRAQ